MTRTQTADSRDSRWRWPRSAAEARTHAILAAGLLWLVLFATFTLGTGNRSVSGTVKGPDFLQFYASGFLVRTHQTASLYNMPALHEAQIALVPESESDQYPPVYPPHVAILFAPFSLLPYQPALFLWTLITIVVYALIVRSAWRPVATRLPDRVFVFAAAAAFPPFWSLVVHGQVTVLVLIAFWAGWIALERGRPFLAGLGFGLLLVKPQFAIALAVVVLAAGEWRMLAGAVTAIGIQIAAVLLFLGRGVIEAYLAFLPVMLGHAEMLEPKPFQSHSLRAVTRLLPSWLDGPVWLAAVAVVLGITVWIWKSGAPLRVRLGTVILASVLVNPHLIIYDATILALPLIWYGAFMMESSGTRVRRYWTAVYWLFVLLLAPTAAAVRVQGSVFVMVAILGLVAREVQLREPGSPRCRTNGGAMPSNG